jgi:hypothetical protein
MIINRKYESQILLSLEFVSFLVGLRTYQHPCTSCRQTIEVLNFTLMVHLCTSGLYKSIKDVVFFLLGDPPASEFYVSIFRNTLFRNDL